MASVSSTMPSSLPHMIFKYKPMLLVPGAVEHTLMADGSSFLGQLSGPPTSIMAKEMVPILLSCAVWSRMLSKRNIEFKCDNRSAVEAIRKGSSKDIMAMHLLRCLWFLTAIFDIQITVSHIPGVLNTSADLLSRNQLKQFRTLHPQASTMPTSIPSALTMLISPTKPDWTSSSFQHNLHELLPLNNN